MWGAPGICSWSTFFLLYINDINKIVTKTEISLFADDTVILASFPTLRTSVDFKNDLGKHMTGAFVTYGRLALQNVKFQIMVNLVLIQILHWEVKMLVLLNVSYM